MEDFAPTRQDYSQIIHDPDNWPDFVLQAHDEWERKLQWLMSEEGRIAAREKFMQAEHEYPTFEPHLIDTDLEMQQECIDLVNYAGIRTLLSRG